MHPAAARLIQPRFLLALGFLLFQLYLLIDPLQQEISLPVHIALSLIAVFIWMPADAGPRSRWIDALLILASVAILAYYLIELRRLSDRMENIDDVLNVDLLFGTLLILVLMEAVRRVVGWSLIIVIAVFVAYCFLGPWMPGWLAFQGFEY